MSDYWFKPKSFGYGSTPTTWQGWVAVLLFTLVVTVPSLLLIVMPAVSGTGPGLWQVVAWLAILGALSWWFMRFCAARTDGELRWRWGRRH